MTDAELSQARRLAAGFLDGMGRADLAGLVLSGDGDDFPEVVVATKLLTDMGLRAAYREEALRTYADAEFWDADLPGGSLASHDRGEIARNVLADHPPFYHRD